MSKKSKSELIHAVKDLVEKDKDEQVFDIVFDWLEKKLNLKSQKVSSYPFSWEFVGIEGKVRINLKPVEADLTKDELKELLNLINEKYF